MAEVDNSKDKKCFKMLAKPTRGANIHVMESGQIRLSALLVKRMGVKPGDKVSFYYVEEGFEPPELYIAKSTIGFKLLKVNPKFEKTTSLRCHSKQITELLLTNEQCADTFKIGGIISQDGIDYYTVIHRQNGTAHKLQGINEIAVGY